MQGLSRVMTQTIVISLAISQPLDHKVFKETCDEQASFDKIPFYIIN